MTRVGTFLFVALAAATATAAFAPDASAQGRRGFYRGGYHGVAGRPWAAPARIGYARPWARPAYAWRGGYRWHRPWGVGYGAAAAAGVVAATAYAAGAGGPYGAVYVDDTQVVYPAAGYYYGNGCGFGYGCGWNAYAYGYPPPVVYSGCGGCGYRYGYGWSRY